MSEEELRLFKARYLAGTTTPPALIDKVRKGEEVDQSELDL
jgi:hypothetical protein